MIMVKRHECIGKITVMKDSFTPGGTPHDIYRQPSTGFQIDIFEDVLKVTDGYCRRLPTIKTQGGRRCLAPAVKEDGLINGHVFRSGRTRKWEQSPDGHGKLISLRLPDNKIMIPLYIQKVI